MQKKFAQHRFTMMWAGYLLTLVAWYVCVKWLPVPSFQRLPDPLTVMVEWLNPDPDYGLSFFTGDYYLHIWYSTYRATTSFALAVLLGVPLGILMGWRATVHEYASALLGILRPIPPLAWVPVAILIFPGNEPAVIFVTFLVAFFATTMNTLLGVRSIDSDYFRAAQCLGAKPRDILLDVIIPGALPSIFTGLQIAMGAAWFSLVAGEMIAAQYGLGFMILESYNLVQYPTIVIMMVTLGIVGYASSAIIRIVGSRLMRWREQSLGLDTA
ncbi:MAG: ABC transporter permease [Gammaproteobacteria bacterium]|nr:ABC transporter permease [Gammaproteobacteria bacterium]